MKTLISLFVTLLSFVFVVAQNTAPLCERFAHFGKVDLCLPVIEGMKECYTDSLVKPLIDATDFKENDILGYYLTTANFKSRSNPEYLTADNYIKLSGVVKLRDYEADTIDLQKACKATEAHIQPQNWSKIKDKIETKGNDINVGVPLLIKKLSVSDDANTYILLTKYISDKRSYIVATALILMLLKKRIISVTYYKSYTSEKDIDTCEEKSSSIVQKLLAANK